MSLGGIICAVFLAWVLFGEDMVHYIRDAHNRRLKHRERMAEIEAEKARAIARAHELAAARSPRTPTRDDVPQDLIDAWHEVNDLTHE